MRAPTSARCRCRSSPASRRPRSRRGSRTREAKVVICADWSLRRGKRIDDARDARRGGPHARRARDRVEPRGARVARARDAAARHAAAGRGRLRGAVPARVHLRHDRQAEGRAARAGRLPRLDRARGRLPDRRQAGRPHPLRHGHGLDHGPVDASSAAARPARRSSSPRARPTGPTTGSGAWSSRSA